MNGARTKAAGPPGFLRLPSGAIIRTPGLPKLPASVAQAGEISYVLGAKLRRSLDQETLSTCQVVRWHEVDAVLGEGLRNAIGSRLPVVPFDAVDVDFRYGDHSPFRPGQAVVLLVDALLTGNTASSVLRVVRRMEAIPLVLSTIVDGRAHPAEPMLTFDGPVPVVSCFGSPIAVAELPPDAVVRDVDPPQRGLAIDRPKIEWPIQASDILAWLRDDPAPGVFIGHIDRGRARHLTTYLNAGRFGVTRPIVAETIAKQAVAAWRSTTPSPSSVRVIYPNEENGYARDLAQAAKAVIANELDCPIEAVGASLRRNAGWVLDTGPWADRFLAVVVDWGVVTATTLRALMSLAARNGASRLHVVALTSQLDPEAEWQLRTISTIRERHAPLREEGTLPLDWGGDGQDEDDVPVSLSLLARAPMGMAASSDCLLCKTAQQLRRDAAKAPTRLLRDHASTRYDLYRPRPLQDVLSRQPVDLVGSPLRSPNAANIWRIHQLLEDARVSTATRISVRAEVMSWTMGELTSSIEDWLRLLTTEAYWLSQPPLNADDLRARIGEACADVVGARTTPVAGHHLRWQAAIVLRAASRRTFVERFAELLEACANDVVVASELCYGMYTLLGRPYNHGREMIARSLVALRDARNYLLGRHASDPRHRDLLRTVNALYRHAIEVEVLARGQDSMAAWHSLQVSYVLPMKSHVGAIKAMESVVSAFSSPVAVAAAQGLAPKPTADDWRKVSDAWEACWDFMAASVFPYLSILADAFDGYVPLVSSSASDSLVSFGKDRAERFASGIADLEHSPVSFSPTARLTLEHEAYAWRDAILWPRQVSGSQELPGARLLRVAEENPCDLGRCWSLAQDSATPGGLKVRKWHREIPSRTYVFCRASLLVDAFVQIIENAAGPRHRAAGRPDEGVSIDLRATSDGGWVKVSIRNDWSEIGEPRLGGLSAYAEELQPFGAELMHHRLDESSGSTTTENWTYEVVIRLREWDFGGTMP